MRIEIFIEIFIERNIYMRRLLHVLNFLKKDSKYPDRIKSRPELGTARFK